MKDKEVLAITLRQAASPDALCIGVLGMQVFLDTYATDGLRDVLAREVLEAFLPATISLLIERPDTRFIVAQRNGHLLGFAQITLQSDHPMIADARAAELSRLYVQERFTGHGIGWRLLEAAETLAAEQGASALWATVWVGNQRALGFYPRQGYAHAGTPIYRLQGEEHENALFLKRLDGG